MNELKRQLQQWRAEAFAGASAPLDVYHSESPSHAHEVFADGSLGRARPMSSLAWAQLCTERRAAACP